MGNIHHKKWSHPMSLEDRKRCSETSKRLGLRPPSFEGKHHTEETKEKIRVGQTGRTGELSGGWRGGPDFRKKSFRRVKRLQIPGSHTAGEWNTLKAKYNFTCPSCHRSEPEIKLTQDHIVPLTKGGSDSIENLQPLCQSCNSKKRVNIIKYEIVRS